MTTFIDSLTICEQDGHNMELQYDWEETAQHFYEKYKKCKNCDKVLKFTKYKWMSERVEEI